MSETHESIIAPTINERILQTVQQALNSVQTSMERQDFLAENLSDVRSDLKKIMHRQGRVEDAFDRLLTSAGRTRGDVLSLTGRIEGLIRTVAEQGGRLDSHEAKLDRHETKLDRHEVKLDRHEVKLDRHTEILDQHTETLNQHTETLNQHTETLNQHTATLARLEAGMEKILAKLEAA
jgi:chromosome segregation ATPase